MPKVTMFFHVDTSVPSQRRLSAIGDRIRVLVAEAASTPGVTLNANTDVDWIPQPYPRGTHAPISIEIETIGYPARKAKLTRERVLRLKEDILLIPQFPKFDPKTLLIWVKFQDPYGVHV